MAIVVFTAGRFFTRKLRPIADVVFHGEEEGMRQMSAGRLHANNSSRITPQVMAILEASGVCKNTLYHVRKNSKRSPLNI